MIWIEKNYVNQINKQWEEIKKDKNSYVSSIKISINKNEREDEFNKRLSESNENSFLLDKKIFRLTGRNDFELCDVLNLNEREIIHVKIYKSSSYLSHLFSQGYVSAKILKSNDYNFLSELSKKLDFTLEKIKNINFSDFKVVFGIVTDYDTDIPAIPFFSKLTFFM